METYEKYDIYWIVRDTTKAMALSALQLGVKPAEVLDALNDGLEDATKEHRGELERAAAGH